MNSKFNVRISWHHLKNRNFHIKSRFPALLEISGDLTPSFPCGGGAVYTPSWRQTKHMLYSSPLDVCSAVTHQADNRHLGLLYLLPSDLAKCIFVQLGAAPEVEVEGASHPMPHRELLAEQRQHPSICCPSAQSLRDCLIFLWDPMGAPQSPHRGGTQCW